MTRYWREWRRSCSHGEALQPIYRQLTNIKDDKVRRAALRDSAEALAARLDSLGRLASKPGPASVRPMEAFASTVGPVRFRDKGIELSELKGAPSSYQSFALPSLTATVADLRSRTPARHDGRASLGLMTENGYFLKFFEDLPQGQFGAEATVQAQGLAAPR